LRVVLVTHAFPPDQIGGVERYTEGLAQGLEAAGDTVTVVAGTRSSGNRCELVREVRSEALTLYWLKRPMISPARFLRHSRALERLFRAVLEETSPDVVHANHLLELSPRFVEAAHGYGAAVVLSLWDYYFVCARIQLRKRSGAACSGPDGGRECARTCFAREQAAAARWRARTVYFQRVLGSADRIMSPSQHVAAYFRPFVPEPLRLHVLPLGLTRRQALAAPRRRTDDRLSLAVLGQVYPAKGAHLVLAALERAGLEGARLAVEGRVVDAPYAQRLAAQASQIDGLEFRLGGEYAHEELPDRLTGVDLVVVPSQDPETFAFVAREALAAGIPILAARIGALPEAVVEGENGYTFVHDDPSELASLVRLLDGDRSLLGRLRSGARRRPPLPMAAHVRATRSLYADAIQDLARNGPSTGADPVQLRRLESRLVKLGFGGSSG
jgi:glycosyltransferase involved in cell wall biosynthesis